MASPDLATVGAFAAIAFVPPLVLLFWLRGRERYDPEPSGPVLKAFLWGAVGGILLALAVQLVFLPIVTFAVLVVLVAPLSEELAKALGLRWVRDATPEPEDGLVYGAAAGFGFAATENLVYQVVTYLGEGEASAFALGAMRVFTSALVHASATALVGLAIWMRRRGEARSGAVVVAYLGAVVLHGSFNGALLLDPVIGFAFAVALAWIVGWSTVRRVKRLDALSGGASNAPSPTYPPMR